MTILNAMLLAAGVSWLVSTWMWINLPPSTDSANMLGRFMYFMAGVLTGGLIPMLSFLPRLTVVAPL